ncbi:ABC transporter ATP-binding protein, partial [Nodularia spumigena CS-591/04]|nr:ABC transporter ATP-binding protein [Nodularia spumigena CS-591/04]
DESFKNKCKQRIESFWHEKTTVLVVSHDLDFVQQSCDRVVWLDKGKIVFIGETKKAINSYLQQCEGLKSYP